MIKCEKNRVTKKGTAPDLLNELLLILNDPKLLKSFLDMKCAIIDKRNVVNSLTDIVDKLGEKFGVGGIDKEISNKKTKLDKEFALSLKGLDILIDAMNNAIECWKEIEDANRV